MESSVPSSSPEFRWRGAALALAVPLVVFLAAIIIRLSLEAGHRHELEQIVASTAVGDRAWYQLPVPEPAVPVSVGTYQGQPLLPVSYRHVEVRDSRVTLAATDDAGHLRLYTTREPLPSRAGEAERRNEPSFLIKTGPEQYLRVQPAGRGK